MRTTYGSFMSSIRPMLNLTTLLDRESKVVLEI